MITMSSRLLGLVSVLSLVTAHPQLQPRASSVTLYEFEPVASGVNPTSIDGTEWAQPIGTASDGSVTTFIVENVFTTSGLVSVSGAIGLSTVTETGILTADVSASGWGYSNFPSTTSGSTQLGGELQCAFTASTSGECILEEVLDDGTTSTITLTGDAITQVLPISTGTLPSGGAGNSIITSSPGQSTVTALPTTAQQSTVTAPPTANPSSAASTSASASSNAASALRAGFDGLISEVIAVAGGLTLGASILFI